MIKKSKAINCHILSAYAGKKFCIIFLKLIEFVFDDISCSATNISCSATDISSPSTHLLYVWDPITNMRSIKHRKVHLNVTLNAGL